MAKDCDGAGLRNETMDHGVTASGRQARDSTLYRRGFLIGRESDSRYLNGNMQGWADVLVHAGSNGRARRVGLPGEMTGKQWALA
jgi:hypothetical protein